MLQWSCGKKKGTFNFCDWNDWNFDFFQPFQSFQRFQLFQEIRMMERVDYDHSELLRFITCGSVDDGKSTLIGRLLHDSKSIFEDQLAAVERSTHRRGAEGGGFIAVNRWPAGGTGAGHYDRCRVPLFRHAQAQIHHRRYAGPRAVHAQHGHRRLDGQSGGDSHRRAQRRADPVAPPCLYRQAVAHSASAWWR